MKQKDRQTEDMIIDVKAKFVMTVFKQEALEGTDGSRKNSHRNSQAESAGGRITSQITTQ